LTIKLTPNINFVQSLSLALLLVLLFLARQIFSCQRSEKHPRPIGREGWRLESSTPQRESTCMDFKWRSESGQVNLCGASFGHPFSPPFMNRNGCHLLRAPYTRTLFGDSGHVLS